MVKVSIIIPVYNASLYLTQCIDSLLNQTFKDFEIICVDDGSTDGSLAILYKYVKKDNRIKVIEKEHHEGVGAGEARNMGLEEAEGKYVYFLDADDYLVHNALLELIEKADKTSSDIVVFNSQYFNANTGAYIFKYQTLQIWALKKMDIIDFNRTYSGQELSEYLYQVTYGAVWNLFFRRDFVRQENLHFQTMRYTDDTLFSFGALAVAKKIAFLDKKLIFYRYNVSMGQSQSRYKYKEVLSGAAIAVYDFLQSRGLFNNYKKTFIQLFAGRMKDYLANQETYEGFKAAFLCIKNELFVRLQMYDFEWLKSRAPEIYWFIIHIKRMSIEEYLYSEPGIILGDRKFIPSILEFSRVVIYGAGSWGKRLYNAILLKGNIEVVAWVDLKGDEIGYPVVSVDRLFELEYDYIWVCIFDKKTADNVKKYLMQEGVLENKIVLLSNTKNS